MNMSGSSQKPSSTPSPSRRDFLRKTGTAGAFLGAGGPNLLTSQKGKELSFFPEQAPPPVPGQDEPIRMAVIGTGGMGTGHCHSIMGLNRDGHEKVHIVALADVCKPRLDRAHKACSEGQPGVEVAAYRNYEDILKREDIHGVLIASPEHWHWKQIIDSLRAGKDVYCEKPMTLRLNEALAVYKEVHQRTDRVFTVGTQMIMQPKYAEAKKMLRENVIGTPLWSQTSYCRNTPSGEWNYYGLEKGVVPGEMLDWDGWCGPQPKIPFDTKVYHRWRRYKDWSTGVIGDLLVHVMTPLIWTVDLGWPVRVTGAGNHFVDMDMENHDQVNMTVEFERKHHMVVAGATNNDLGLETIIRGQKGTIFLGGAHCKMTPQRHFVDELDEIEVKCSNVHDHNAMRLDWLRCIRSREVPAGNIELAARVMVAVDLATRSMWEGSAFYFDIDTHRVHRG
ncbi:MAG: gfo/Idh/MocA family oxidoreductase [Planctomycetota bacterium]|nr:MAG: gfo/Idh/MocA family oxidoreductase [Planctomycetota bacterium]